ncbi:KTSC domain-containing protein [Acinetobacter sp. WU_MDCI_Abxa265]|uniref:KTSC domain-containing protein n=1 Tax=Acinetobacter sp. WU_MDCI_Abxa265 TaxID=2850077 RepID=UPI0021CDA21F|nr:KTSC domain-containing protein [Acinetobacter sp. WU_MDCI_Abxa265]MCU4634895.1 KTSC domain-containing protein [Acinetobacter sp. WU_MDCI_Abxa265]
MSKVVNVDSELINFYVVVNDHAIEIDLKDGDRVCYSMMDSDTVNKFLAAPNKDQFYLDNIKSNRNFRFEITLKKNA